MATTVIRNADWVIAWDEAAARHVYRRNIDIAFTGPTIVFVGNTDAEAESIGVPAFQAMVESRAALRNRIYRDTGMRIEVPQSDLPSARASVEHGFIHGSPERVAGAIAEIAALGIGGVIATFRLGPLPHEAAAESLTLFMRQVAPELRSPSANG